MAAVRKAEELLLERGEPRRLRREEHLPGFEWPRVRTGTVGLSALTIQRGTENCRRTPGKSSRAGIRHRRTAPFARLPWICNTVGERREHHLEELDGAIIATDLAALSEATGSVAVAISLTFWPLMVTRGLSRLAASLLAASGRGA